MIETPRPYYEGWKAHRDGTSCPYLPFSDEAIEWQMGYDVAAVSARVERMKDK